MKTYDECRKIAEEMAKSYNATISKAYTIGSDYVFDTDDEVIGVFPLVVLSETGNTSGIWNYLNTNDKTMDDMQEIDS